MNVRKVVVCLFVMMTGLTSTAVFALAEGDGLPMEHNYSVPDVVTAFENLTTQGEWLGYHMNDAFGLDFSGDASRHIQGIARSPRFGISVPPVFYVTNSGELGHSSEYPGIMVVRLGSRPETGERLRSNRLEKGEVTTNTPPTSPDDKLIISMEDELSRHPSGIQMVGDILAVPSGGEPSPEDIQANPIEPDHPGMIYLYNGMVIGDPDTAPEHREPVFELLICQTPAHGCPKNNDDLAPHERETCHGVQGVGITRLPEVVDEDGTVTQKSRLLLVTNDGYGAHFHWSNGEPLFRMDNTITPPSVIKNELFQFEAYQFVPIDDIKDEDGNSGYWPTKEISTKAFQSLSLVDQVKDRVYGLFLIGSCNSDKWSPSSIGEDQLYLLEVKNPQTPGQLQLVGIHKEVNKTLLNPGSVLDINKRYNGNFNAGGYAYASPSGELLYYGVSHWNDGPGDTIKIAELRHKNVVRDDSPTYSITANAGGPYEVNEGDTVQLNGNFCQPALAAPWVHLFQHASYEGQSVMVDYGDRDLDDYDNFSKLDEEPLLLGGDLCLDEAKKAELTQKLDDFKKEIESLGMDDFFEEICLGVMKGNQCWLTPPVADTDECLDFCDDTYEWQIDNICFGRDSCKWWDLICKACRAPFRLERSLCKEACEIVDGVRGEMIPVPWVDAGVWTLFRDAVEITDLFIENVEAYKLCGRLLDFDLDLKLPMPELTYLKLESWGFDPDDPASFILSDQEIEDRINLTLSELDDYFESLIDLWEDILLSLKGFNNMASSVRWYAPAGMNITLYAKADYEGASKVLTGTGYVTEIANLSDWNGRARSV